jgi:hypothetical protein
MAEYETKDKEEKEGAKRRKKAEPVYDRLKHTTELDDSRGDRAEAMLELQQSRGNKYVQRLAEGNREATLDEDIIRRIESQRPSGKSLKPEVRSEMEAAFRHNFSQVRIHTNGEADRLSRELNAKAFTAEEDIFFFKESAYEPGTETGRHLLTHELTHVMQQSHGASENMLRLTNTWEAGETEANMVAGAFADGKCISSGPRAEMARTVARMDDGEGPEVATAEEAGIPVEAALPSITRGSSEQTLEWVPEEAAWMKVSGEEARAILNNIQLRRKTEALGALWNALKEVLPLANRITVELTDPENLGNYAGQKVFLGATARAITLTYVFPKPECSGAQTAESHRQVHTASEIHAIIQINPIIFDGEPKEQLAVSHSTIMHEYTHVRQCVERGINEHVTFIQVQDKEFLQENIPERDRVEALDEIDAICSEIEHARLSGLAEAYGIRQILDYLWESYEKYYSSLEGQSPDKTIAERVHRNIENGRALLWEYLHSPQGQWVGQVQSPVNVLRQCPLGYIENIIEKFVQGYQHIEYTEAEVS